jgi:transcriptional regulator CtsR
MESSDVDFSKKQKEIIDIYCYEMKIGDIEYDEDSFNLNSLLKTIKDKESQIIFLLEIMTLVYSDNILHEEDGKILNSMINIFGFEKIYQSYMKEWTKAMLALSEQGRLLLKI